MNDEEEKPSKPVLTLVNGANKQEAVTPVSGNTAQESIDDSIEELRTFVNEVVDNLEDKITSPIAGAAVVLIHRDGGVSHGHTCSQRNLTALLGAMSLKIRRLESSYQRGE